MAKDSSDATGSQSASGTYKPGENIRITSGKLAGLTGKIAWLRENCQCVLKIDGWADGVYVVVDSESLEWTEA